ncbi:MAG: YceD family protein [Steroidobacteraceae bacterium]
MRKASKEPLDALNLAAAAAVVEREFRLADFARLVDRLATPEGAVRARMVWRSIGGVPTGELEVRAEGLLTCQRCLGPMRRILQSASQLAFVERDDAPVPADHEAIPGDPHEVDLAGLVEDELLLSLPLIAMHGAGEECKAQASRVAGDTDAGPPAQEMRRPFADLKELLKH